MWIHSYVAILLIILNSNTETAPTGCESCDNGECQDGVCVCDSGYCWDGEQSCKSKGTDTLTFSQEAYSVTITEDVTFNSVIQKLVPCSRPEKGVLTYELTPNVPGFTVDATTGDVSIGVVAFDDLHPRELTVRASLGAQQVTVPVTVTMSTEVQKRMANSDPEIIKSRKRRAVPYVTEPEFAYTLVNTVDDTSLLAGTLMQFQLLITIPQSNQDMLVELFVPDNDTTLMSLCNIVTTCGKNLDCANLNTTKESREGNKLIDRAILDFVGLNNNGGDDALVDHSQIKITYDVVVTTVDLTKNGAYYISIGAEYDSSNSIWVGQKSCSVNNTASPPQPMHDPQFNMTLEDPAGIPIGASAMVDIDMAYYGSAHNLLFDAFSNMDGFGLFTPIAKLESYGSCFQCLWPDSLPALVAHNHATTHQVERVRLDLGAPITKCGREASPDVAGSKISMKALICVDDDDTLIGQSPNVGFAMELGDIQIWAGQSAIPVVAKITDNTAPNPPPSLSASMVTNTSQPGGPVVIDVQMTFQTSSESNSQYSMEVVVPVGQMSICYFAVVSQGVNIPCPLDKRETTYDADKSRATIDLQFIRVVSAYDPAVHTGSYTIHFKFIAKTLAHASNINGATLPVTFGLTYASMLNVLSANVNIEIDTSGSGSSTTMDSTEYPVMVLSHLNGAGSVPKGGYGVVELKITTKPGVIYMPMESEVIGAHTGSEAQYRICSVEVSFIGANLPCSLKEDIEQTVVASSKDLNDIMDKIVLVLGFMYNPRAASKPLLHPDDDSIMLKIVFQMLDITANAVASTEWLSAGLQFHELRLWVGQIQFTVDAPSPHTVDTLFLEALRSDDANEVTGIAQVGRSVRYFAVVKPHLGSQGTVQFKVSVTHLHLSICGIRVKSIGTNLGCGYTDEKTVVNTTHASDPLKIGTMEMDLGILAQTGLNNITENATIDDDSLVIEVIVFLDKAATVGSSYTVNMELMDGTTSLLSDPKTINAVAENIPQSTPTDEIGEFNLAMGSIGDESIGNDIAPGEVKKFEFDMYIKPDTSNYHTLKFLGPVNYTGSLEICSVIVLSVGRNLLCLRKEMFTTSGLISSRLGSSYSDIGSLDIGYACNYPFYNDTEENKIRFEVIASFVRLPSLGAPLPDGTSIAFSVTVRINLDHIYVTQYMLNLLLNRLISPTTSHNVIEAGLVYPDITLVSLQPGKTGNITLRVKVPQNAILKGLVDMVTPVKLGSATMVFKSAKVVRAGRNLACFANRADKDLEVLLTSPQQTSQNTKAQFEYQITNSGIHARNDDYEDTDDSFDMELEIQQADSPANVALSKHQLDTISTLGLPNANVTNTANRDVEVTRDNLEEPKLLLNATLEDNLSVFDPSGNGPIINATLQHDNETSTAEAYNVTVTWYHPFLAFNEIISTDMIETGNAPNIITSNQGETQFVFDHIYFTDVIQWSFRMDVVSTTSNLVPGSVQDVVVPYEAFSEMIRRTGNGLGENGLFTTEVDDLSVHVRPSISVQCAVASLGIADSTMVQDCQITGSNSVNNARGFKDARFGVGVGWQADNRHNRYKKYLQVYFGNRTKVSEVKIGTPAGGAVPSQVTLQASNDGRVWFPGVQVSVNPGSWDSLPSSVEGRYLRVGVDAHSGGVVDDDVIFTMEARGCYSTGDVSPSDVCQSPKMWDRADPPQLYQRSYVIADSTAGTSAFFCDQDPDDEDAVLCHRSSDGSNWYTLDPSVVSVIGFYPDQETLYGLGADKRTYLISEDFGDTWHSINQVKFSADQAQAGFISSTSLPLVQSSAFRDSLTEPSSTYQAHGWGATYKGMFHYTGSSWKQVTDWTSCCA